MRRVTVPAGAVIVLTVALVIATLCYDLASPGGCSAGCRRPRLARAADAAPDLLVSEDARLMAMPHQDGRLAVNRQRTPAFTIDDWQRALQLTTTGLAGPAIKPPRPASVSGS